MVLALVVIFGARLYVRSQAILFSAPDIALWGVESGALLIGCVFLTLAYARTGWAEIDVYPSSAVLRSSLTVLIVGGYLFIVGVLAQVVRRFGGAEVFQFQAFVVLLGMAGLAVLLLSDRARQKIHAFVARHFRKAQHDSVRIWTLFSQRLASVTDQAGLCAVSAKLISETFDVLSVTLWLLDEEKGQLVVGASTARQVSAPPTAIPRRHRVSAVAAGLRTRSSPFDLEDVNERVGGGTAAAQSERRSRTAATACVFPCAPENRASASSCWPIASTARLYTVEELELLKCIGDQITSVLLNLRLASEVARAKELEAFRTMSAFFVHDLKNAAASLNLMLKNLPVHFDDPAFREDALRGDRQYRPPNRRHDRPLERSSAAARLHVRVDTDLNQLVSEALDSVNDDAERRTDERVSAAAQDSRRPRADPERRDQPGAERARRAGPGGPDSGAHGASREAASFCP